MRLLNVGDKGRERAAMLDDQDRLRDLSTYTRRITGATLAPRVLDRLRDLEPGNLPELDPALRRGPCVLDVPDFLCIGLNYARHAEESGMAPPVAPIVFSKASSALAGPQDDLMLPPGSSRVDWEVELGVVVGQEAWQLSSENALEHVAGYCLVNDISERAWQLDTPGQWITGKSGPGFGPVGPWLLTADKVHDPQDIALWLEVNGKRVQSSSTADMIHDVVACLVWVTRHMALRPGTVIATGTPEGVGMGMSPQRWLAAGDEMRCGADGLGTQHQRVIALAPANGSP